MKTKSLIFWVFFASFCNLSDFVYSDSKQTLDETDCVSLEKGKKCKYYLSAVAIFRDEARFLKEWIEYHRLQGVEHFYLYNNLSEDNYLDVLQSYIDQNIVELIEWPFEHTKVGEWRYIQTSAYHHAIDKSKTKTKWLLIYDTDEFFVPNRHESFAKLLKDLEKQDPDHIYASYYFYWIIFGTSGIEQIPDDKLMIEVLTKNAGPHTLYKCVARPKYIADEINAHWVRLKKGKKGKYIPLETLQINHYMYRDRKFLFEVKIPRRQINGTDPQTFLRWESNSNKDNDYGEKILCFVPKLKKVMSSVGSSDW